MARQNTKSFASLFHPRVILLIPVAIDASGLRGFQVAKSDRLFEVKVMSDHVIIRVGGDPAAIQKPIRPVLPTLETIHDVAAGMQSYVNYFEENPKEVVTTVEFTKLCRAVEIISNHVDNREKQEKAQTQEPA